MANANDDWQDIPLKSGTDDWQDIKPSNTQEPSVEDKTPGYLESAARGAAQGLTFGFADELQAKTEELLMGEDYDKRVKEIRERNKQAAEENPITYYGADVLSGFALPIGAFGTVAKNAPKLRHLSNLTKAAEVAGDAEKAAYYAKQAAALTPTLTQKAGQAAGMGAAIGGLAGTGTSEGETAKDVLGDAAMGATAGAVLGPLLEGAISGISSLTSGTKKSVGAVKDVQDFYKYGREGVKLTGPENYRRVTGEGFETVEKQLIPELENSLKVKNRMFEEGKTASEAANKTINIKQLEQLVDQAENAGVDPKQIEKLRRELGVLGKKAEVEVTDPGEYQTLLREKLSDESQKLKERAYELQLKNAEKAGSAAAKAADSQNKELLKITQAELRASNPSLSSSELQEQAQAALRGKLKDPQAAATEAREKVLAEAQEAFSGPRVNVEPITGQPLTTAAIGPNKNIIKPTVIGESGTLVDNVTTPAAVEISKMADKNAAYAYALAERENNKAINDLAKVYSQKSMMASRNDMIQELKNTGKWTDPVSAAKLAKEETILSGKPIDVSTAFSPEINRSVMTASSGDQELVRKILPNFKFTKQQYQNEDMGVRDVEAFRNFITDLTKKDPQIDFRSTKELNKISGQVKDTYNDLLGQETAKAAMETDQTVRKALAELGVDSLVRDSGIENKVDLRDKLARVMASANTAKGASEAVKVENAFKGLKEIYKNNPDKLREVTAAFNSVKDKMRQAYLSDVTTGHNTFAIDPTSINWTMTAAGKIGMAANELGYTINRVAESNPGQLMAQAKRFLDKGYKSYAATFEKMAMQTPQKRRALMYTLLQQPEFRSAFGADIMGTKETPGE